VSQAITAVVALLVLPLVMLRGRTLARYYGCDALTWLLAGVVWLRIPSIDPWLGGVVVAVVKLATFALFVARGRDVIWSANRAAIVAAIVYAITIPAMVRVPIDGDEPFYLLLTESIAGDVDLDLANQYRTLERSAAGRTDLVPQLGDPTGPNGEQYSRHEPFLALLMLPGYLAGGLAGAVATIALFGVLLVRSTIRWMEDEGVPEESIRATFALFAFAPPMLFYATRIWPEVPAAFFFVEAVRGIRAQRMQRWLPMLLGLVLLKLRFLLVAIGLFTMLVIEHRRGASLRKRDIVRIAIAAMILLVPLAIMYFVSGDATSVHDWRELLPGPIERYAIGFFGLLADGMSGIAFQAPFYLLGLHAITRWRDTPRGLRLALLAAIPYVIYLSPRHEWFGGWAPPLRYVVFLMPALALGAASVWTRLSRGAIALVSVATAALVVHGVAFPWRKFHIANGENAVGEWLSALHHTDYSRLFPSFIRLNGAAWLGAIAIVLVIVFGVRRWKIDLAIPIAALLLSLALVAGQKAGNRVEFEDAHVVHDGGELFPELYRVFRVAYRGGWLVHPGDSMSFLAREGKWTLHAVTGLGATIQVGGRAYEIRAAEGYQQIPIVVSKGGRVRLECLSGALNLDRMDRE
jgi:hypothetical protein